MKCFCFWSEHGLSSDATNIAAKYAVACTANVNYRYQGCTGAIYPLK